MIKILFIISFVVVAGINSNSSAAPLSESDMVDFLTQSLCLDDTGRPSLQIPVIDSCISTRPQRGDDRAVYQKYDWPDNRQPGHFKLSHQASDSVLQGPAGKPVIEQTFAFGNRPNQSFDRFSHGDGGQAILLINGWASAVMTEDSTEGVQWFISNGCNRSVESGRLSWLLFNQNVPTGRWADTVANLATGRSPSDCPQHFNLAYTRYRRERIVFPFRVIKDGAVTMTSRPLDVVVSEHFGGAATNPASNAHLERFYFARHFGWVRWERWQNGNNPAAAASRRATFVQRAQDLDNSGRCPMVDYSTSPGPGWHRVDCRTWTTVVLLTKPWSVNNYRWAAFGDTNWR